MPAPTPSPRASSGRPIVLLLAIAAGALLLGLRAASAPPWPDDWDGIGFVLSIRHFDLAAFQPHAPGYPVYVALLRIAGRLWAAPIDAANAVAVTCGVAATALFADAARRVLDAERSVWIAIAVAVTPLAWRVGTAIGSEAPALLFVALAVNGLARGGPFGALLLGGGVGLGLGVRVSWGPLFLGILLLAPRGARLRAGTAATLAVVAWLAPFVALVGVRPLVTLLTTQAAGHGTVWGGTALTEPGPMRLVYFARDLVVDGIGADRDPLGLAIGFTAFALAKAGLEAWHARGWDHARRVALVLAPYAVWILVGQNLRAQPRHALPLVVALAAALALAATATTRARTIGVAFFALVALRTLSDAAPRVETPPPGAQLVERVRSLEAPDRVAIFGGPSARFFALTDRASQAMTVETLGDATLALGRMPRLPSRVLVTDEVSGLRAEKSALTPFATLCRPPRLDRRAPCLKVFEWRPSFVTP